MIEEAALSAAKIRDMRRSKDAEGQKVLVCSDVVCQQQDLGRDKIPRREDQKPPATSSG